MNPLLSQILGVLVRFALVALGTSLAEHGTLAPDQVAHLTSNETVLKVSGWLMMGLPVVWSIIQKHGAMKQLVAALHLAPGSTMEEVNARAAKPDIAATDMKAKL